MRLLSQLLEFVRADFSLRLYLALALIATVASVPTSVLVQNSELASNAQQNHPKNSNKIFNGLGSSNSGVISSSTINKVKRSNDAQSSSSKNSPESAVNKKSSPEIVPASYTAPPRPKPNFSVPQQQQQQLDSQEANQNYGLQKSNDVINSAIAAGLVEAAAVAANQRELEQLRKQQRQYYADEAEDEQQAAAINKRGISNQQQYGYTNLAPPENSYENSAFIPPPPSSRYPYPYGTYETMPPKELPQPVWGEDLDTPSVVYSDIDEYGMPMSRVCQLLVLPYPFSVPASYHNKAYDNLQTILNSENYMDSLPPPLPYNSGRYYNGGAETDRNKRAYKVFNQLANKFPDMRLKRDTKLTPADMLALVALVEAGERARKDTDADAGYMYPPESYVPKAYGLNNNYNTGSYDYPSLGQVDDSLDYNNGPWLEPQSMVDYYGVPMNMEPMGKYDTRMAQNENKFNERIFNNKHGYMVAKKKRSIAKPIIPYKQDKLY
ncbi:uncharacterized protein LOC106087607 isoform X1 [Stomoxys calcitrans]|uniref:uncharacterized protein LOC106087607 isoform X1 n=1 Tax=Stomoxys calcitrans TaxID=35570 RepID=UPI0027E2D2A7|nr:uncharacterized protein LOC106087607 isoform X1 [Stomoxys calcitrans]